MTTPERSIWYEIIWNIVITVFGLTLFSWVLVLTLRTIYVESKVESNLIRISNLETGRSTPMSSEARAEFGAVWRKIDELSGTKSKTKSPQ